MNKRTSGVLAVCGLIGLSLVGMALGNGAVDGDAPAIMASPSTIVLAKVDAVTIHTNIPAGSVEPATVALNGVAPTGLGADSLGHLVARFALAELNLEPGQATLTLTGQYADTDDGFSASDVVTVK